MSTAEKVAKGSIGVGLGEVIEKGSLFLRNLVLARMLSPADFGLGATFLTTYLLFMMISSFSTSQYLVQSDSGEDVSLQKSVHLMELLRGLFSGIAIFLTAGWISSLFGAPEAKWAFQLLAVIPLLLGVVHTDIFRFQRRMNFYPSVVTAVASDVMALLLAFPAALYYPDYTAALICLVVKIFTYLLLSHYFSERRYRIGGSLLHLKGIWIFGWPLLLNGGLIFLTLQGDRMVIGAGRQIFSSSVFTLSDLGAFSVAFSFTWVPTVMAIRVMTKVILPYLAEVKDNSGLLSQRLLSFYPFAAFYSIGLMVVFIIGGGVIITVFCGKEYLVDPYLVIWLAAAHGIRAFRSLPGLCLVAVGDTRSYLYGNIIRAAAFVATIAVSASGLYLQWIGFSIFITEFFSFLYTMIVINRNHSVPLRGSLSYLLLIPGLVPVLIIINGLLGPYDGRIIARMMISIVLMGLISLGIILLMGDVYRKNLVQMFRNMKNDIKIQF